MDKNLHLEYRLTNRAGYDVFEIFSAEDNKRMRKPLGLVKLPPHGVNTSLVTWVSDTNDINDNIKNDWSEQLESPLEGGQAA